MNILILGSGGREHAFAWKISQSKLCSELFIAPGNAGTTQYGKNVSIRATDFAAIKTFCEAEKIEMIVVGPEDPLVLGICDFFKNEKSLQDIQVIGPSKAGAQLEGSKDFSKQFMQRYGIPTAAYASFTEQNFEAGLEYLKTHSLPIVLKADGLAAGKGVVICQSHNEATSVFNAMIRDRQFGEASNKVVVEQFLSGIEVSVFVMTDGKDYKIIGHAKDYKRIGEGDAGPNTGGMGCVSPVPFVDEYFIQKVEDRIIKPTIDGLFKETLEYKGFLFFGLIKVDNEPFVIEYNCRMGDPETEVILPLLNNDLVALCESLHNGTLAQQNIEINKQHCATVVAVSGGYPDVYEIGFALNGLSQNKTTDSIVFHAGTKQIESGIVTNGGRVLAVSSFGNTLNDAVSKSYKTLADIHFDGMGYRKDIGFEFL